MGEVVAGVDAVWLKRAAEADPVTHAYAVWDLEHEGDRVRFLSYREGPATRAYLVVWRGSPSLPMVHWVGSDQPAPLALLDAMPPRPLLAVVPPRLAREVAVRRGPIDEYPIEIRVRPRHAPVPEVSEGARRLTRSDLPELGRFVQETPSPLLEPYRTIDPERIPVFGVFQREELVAVAKASVSLPAIWILSGIVVAPAHRGLGLGRAVTGVAVRAAAAAGALVALYVRSDNVPALRTYERLGFQTRERRIWIDAGGNREP